MAPGSVQLRFTIPIDSVRPKGAARFEFWAPKIGRRITLFHPLQVQLWTLLESHPRVSSYCERPAYWQRNGGQQLTDFWGRAGRREICWVIVSQSEAGRAGVLSPAENVEVRYISATSLASRHVWLENWMRILPYLSANARFVSDRLMNDIEQASSAAPTLGDIERDFQPHDVVLVRTAAFMLLHRGRLRADGLRAYPLGPRIVLQRSAI